MTFRTKLILVTSLTVTGAIALVTGAVSAGIRRTFESIDASRRAAVLERFREELAAQGEQVVRTAARIAAADAVQRLAVESNRAEPDFAPYVSEAQALAEAHGLDFLDLARMDGRIISSAHYMARFGYPHGWALGEGDAPGGGAFLTRIPAQIAPVLALGARHRATAGGGKGVEVLGGRRLDVSFLKALESAPGVRVLLWRAEGDVLNAHGTLENPTSLAPLIEDVRRTHKPGVRQVEWNGSAAKRESVYAQPLEKDGALLAVLLVATSLDDQVRLERSILYTGLGVGAVGILLGVLIGWWTTARVTHPVAELVRGARAVAAGDYEARVVALSTDELGELARAFNHMTAQLVAQRDRAVQAERVAAWRELARRLAHELKNPLFPLQITVENLRKAHQVRSADFDEILRESTSTLLVELANLKSITARFSDFAKMPAPRFESVELNELTRQTARLHAPTVDIKLDLLPEAIRLDADPEQLRRMLTNLILNARDAMPDGGELSIATGLNDGHARIRVSDTGQGLSTEECERLFTPYYTTKQHGTGLGLAIVQSVVSDHRGRISVASEPGRGTTFIIDLPLKGTS